VAGYGLQEAAQMAVAASVVPFHDAARLIWCLAPSLVTPELEPMWRTALTGSGPAPGFQGAPRRARWLSPFAWRRIAYTVTPDALVIRTGFWIRCVTVVPHQRVQGVSAHAGPLQRLFGLATVRVHSTAGPVLPHLPHLNADDAAALVRAQTSRWRARPLS
jgi:putative membrane protein